MGYWTCRTRVALPGTMPRRRHRSTWCAAGIWIYGVPGQRPVCSKRVERREERVEGVPSLHIICVYIYICVCVCVFCTTIYIYVIRILINGS